MIANSAARLVPLTPMSDQPPRAPRYIMWRGQEILRVTGFLRGKIIHCPDRHVVKTDSLILGDGVLFCDYRPANLRPTSDGAGRPAQHHAPCGALIYLLTIPSRGDKTHRFWLADCTRSEIKEVERRGLDADGIVDYFGGSFGR